MNLRLHLLDDVEIDAATLVLPVIAGIWSNTEVRIATKIDLLEVELLNRSSDIVIGRSSSGGLGLPDEVIYIDSETPLFVLYDIFDGDGPIPEGHYTVIVRLCVFEQNQDRSFTATELSSQRGITIVSTRKR